MSPRFALSKLRAFLFGKNMLLISLRLTIAIIIYFLFSQENYLNPSGAVPRPLFWFLQKNQNGGLKMKKINLRDYYPFYQSDFFVEVTDEIASSLKCFKLSENAYKLRTYRHKAYYSLDRGDGIEQEIVFISLSPQEIYERRVTNHELYTAINSLPEKQAKRVYAHFFLGISKTAIAKADGIRESAVRESIERGLKNIEKFLKNFL
uniref:hypothetical protein n=1 Tax=Dehalobacter restrictus TaxID=55583 RepID=UPI003EBE706A